MTETDKRKMLIDSEFYKITLPLERNLFYELFNSVDFETITNGRLGNNLVQIENNTMPIVRTTAKYNIPAHKFSNLHQMLINSITQTVANNGFNNIPPQNFNNALIEVYDSNYYKMNFHSDQSLDLDNDSYIGLFSCYEKSDKLTEQNLRKLKIRNKLTLEEFEISLTHNSVILFSFAANMKFQHKIILDSKPNSKLLMSENKWLGITFRKSKTRIQIKDDLPYFSDGQLLELADKSQEAEFYMLRGQENRSSDFIYPNLTYTLSLGDTLTPENCR